MTEELHKNQTKLITLLNAEFPDAEITTGELDADSNVLKLNCDIAHSIDIKNYLVRLHQISEGDTFDVVHIGTTPGQIDIVSDYEGKLAASIDRKIGDLQAKQIGDMFAATTAAIPVDEDGKALNPEQATRFLANQIKSMLELSELIGCENTLKFGMSQGGGLPNQDRPPFQRQ